MKYDKEQVLAALAPVYGAARDRYSQLTEESLQIDEEEYRAYRAAARKAMKAYSFMEGVTAAAKALGITEIELFAAALQDKYIGGGEKAD